MMIETIHYFIGTAPVGFEWLEYFASMCVFLLLFRFVTDTFRWISNILKMR